MLVKMIESYNKITIINGRRDNSYFNDMVSTTIIKKEAETDLLNKQGEEAKKAKEAEEAKKAKEMSIFGRIWV